MSYLAAVAADQQCSAVLLALLTHWRLSLLYNFQPWHQQATSSELVGYSCVLLKPNTSVTADKGSKHLLHAEAGLSAESSLDFSSDRDLSTAIAAI